MQFRIVVFCLVIAMIIPAMSCARGSEIVLESDGWQLHGDWAPAGMEAPAVLLLHDAAGDRHDLEPLADALNAAGLHALRLELRGHGASINLGRFEPPYSEHLHVNQYAWRDIAAGIRWLRARPEVSGVAVVGASYSGEQAALALREGKTPADTYVMLSPGNFGDESMAAIDPSGVPWLFLRTEEESAGSLRWIDEVFETLPAKSSSAEVRVYPGGGHASEMLVGRPDLTRDIAAWIAGKWRPE